MIIWNQLSDVMTMPACRFWEPWLMLELNRMLFHIQQPLRSKVLLNESFHFIKLVAHLKGAFFHNLKILGFWHIGIFPFALQVCVESKNFTQALALYKEMKSYGTHPNLVSELLSCYGSIFPKIINLDLSTNSMQYGWRCSKIPPPLKSWLIYPLSVSVRMYR